MGDKTELNSMANQISTETEMDGLETKANNLIKELKLHRDLIKSTCSIGKQAKNNDKIRKDLMKRIKSIFNTCAASSSVHGVANIFKSQLIANRVMWAVFFLLYTIICSLFMVSGVRDFLSYDVVSKIKKIRQDSIVFPTIYFCIDHKQSLDVLDTSFDGELIHPDKLLYVTLIGHNCYIFNAGKNSSNDSKELFYQDGIGIDAGLRIRFYLGGAEKRLKIYVGEKFVLPRYREFDKLMIEKGKHTDISLSKLVSISMPEPYNNCLNNLNTKSSFDSQLFRLTLDNNYTYRQANCYDICVFKDVSRVCNCTSEQIYADKNYTKNCLDGSDPRVESCKNRVLRRYDFSQKCSQFCPLECLSVSYTFNSHSFGLSVPQNLLDRSREVFLLNGDEIKANLSNQNLRAHLFDTVVSLNIYYLNLHYEELSETPKMSWPDLVSNIGGTMGIYFIQFIKI